MLQSVMDDVEDDTTEIADQQQRRHVWKSWPRNVRSSVNFSRRAWSIFIAEKCPIRYQNKKIKGLSFALNPFVLRSVIMHGIITKRSRSKEC